LNSLVAITSPGFIAMVAKSEATKLAAKLQEHAEMRHDNTRVERITAENKRRASTARTAWWSLSAPCQTSTPQSAWTNRICSKQHSASSAKRCGRRHSRRELRSGAHGDANHGSRNAAIEARDALVAQNLAGAAPGGLVPVLVADRCEREQDQHQTIKAVCATVNSCSAVPVAAPVVLA
jgi:hypothetical protein